MQNKITEIAYISEEMCNAEKNEKERERCTLCGKVTEYTKDTPISERFGYIEGGGQLCKDCYYELYIKKKSDCIEFMES